MLEGERKKKEETRQKSRFARKFTKSDLRGDQGRGECGGNGGNIGEDRCGGELVKFNSVPADALMGRHKIGFRTSAISTDRAKTSATS